MLGEKLTNAMVEARKTKNAAALQAVIDEVTTDTDSIKSDNDGKDGKGGSSSSSSSKGAKGAKAAGGKGGGGGCLPATHRDVVEARALVNELGVSRQRSLAKSLADSVAVCAKADDAAGIDEAVAKCLAAGDLQKASCVFVCCA